MVAHGLWNALRNLADIRPLVIGIDDVHHADPQSLQCLMYFARRIGATKIIMVFGECDQSTTDLPTAWSELVRYSGHVDIHLEPLSAHGVLELLVRHLERDQAQRFAPAVFRLSGGNPLLVAR